MFAFVLRAAERGGMGGVGGRDMERVAVDMTAAERIYMLQRALLKLARMGRELLLSLIVLSFVAIR